MSKSRRADAGLRNAIFEGMPLFLNHRVLFLHIPKCGGDTFSHALRGAGDPPLFFVPDGSVLVNGHTPQHMTWREWCSVGWSMPAGFRVLAFVRHPVDRVMSAYRYVHLARPDLVHLAETPSAFLDNFFSPDPAVRLRFDHHNLGILDFVRNAAGEVDEAIELWHISEMDEALATLGLPAIAPSERRNVTVQDDGFTARDLERVRGYVVEDLAWYEERFGAYPSSDSA